MRERNFGELQYKICGLDRIVDEKGSAFIALRKIAWNVGPDDEVDESKVKLDLRKYYTTAEGERMSKGVSFLTDDGPHELVHILTEEGYGNTTQVLGAIKERDDFNEAVASVFGLESKESNGDGEFYDPRDLLKLE